MSRQLRTAMNHVIAPIALEGWYVLHQFFQVAPAEHDGDPAGSGAGAIEELFRGWEDMGEQGWSGLYRIVGGGVDYMALHLRHGLDDLGDAERDIRRHDDAGVLVPVDDYLSVVELGLYHHSAALAARAEEEDVEVASEEWNAWVAETLEQERGKRYVQGRLRPRQPEDMPWVSFYPMDKRRDGEWNWYTLPVAERARLMIEHGATGRRWAGKVSQIISGSVGLDDWEWGVTLFASDPLHFKGIVTEMRYDDVTSRYGEFGSFRVGRRIATDEIASELGRP